MIMYVLKLELSVSYSSSSYFSMLTALRSVYSSELVHDCLCFSTGSLCVYFFNHWFKFAQQ